jgi:hypothetical protein
MLLLHTTENEKKFYLRQALWARDTPGLMDKIGEDGAKVANSGFIERAAFIQSSAEVHMLIRVIFDFTISQLIPDQTEIFLRFHRSEPKQCLLAKEGDFRIELTKAKLLVPRLQLTTDALRRNHTILAARGMRFTSKRLSVRSIVVSKNDQNCDWAPVSGSLPDRIYIFQTLNSAYNGNIAKNPFNYQSFDLKRVQVYKNGESLPLTQAVQLSAQEAMLLYTLSMDAINRPQSLSFNAFEYLYGYMIICVDLTNDTSAGMSNYNNPKENGTVRITLDYDQPLKEAITVFCIMEESDVLLMDANRNPKWVGIS